MRRLVFVLVATALGLLSFAVHAEGQTAPPKKLKFRWSIRVTHPDDTHAEITPVAGGGRLAMQSTDWSCEYSFRRNALDDGRELESGTVLCVYGGRLASAMFGARCATGDASDSQHMIITEDSLRKRHVIELRCERPEPPKP